MMERVWSNWTSQFCWLEWKMLQPLCKSLAVSYNFKLMLTTQPGNPALRYLSRGNENAWSRKNLYVRVCGDFIQSLKIGNDTNTIRPVNSQANWDVSVRWTAMQNRNKPWINGATQWDSKAYAKYIRTKL